MMILPSAVILILCGVLFDGMYVQGTITSMDCSVCGDEPRSQHYGKTGMCYHVYEELKTWDAAAMDCVERGGKLAMPKDATINFILTEMIEEYTGTDFWIGLSSDDSSVWIWVDNNLLDSNVYENFNGATPAVADDCACIAKDSVSGIDVTGQWFPNSDCDQLQPYICEISYVSPCTWRQDSFECVDRQGVRRCYCLRKNPLLDWPDARTSCQNTPPAVANGDLAVPDHLRLNRQLRNLVDDFYTTTWDAWIGASNTLLGAGWEWVPGVPVNVPWVNFPGNVLPPAGDNGCAAMHSNVGMWDVYNCDEEKWSFCQADFPWSACCDPHFVVRPKGIQEPVCFDYYGKDKDVLQLIYSEKYELAVNAEVFSHEHTKKTWFGALSIILPGCEIIANYKGIHLNNKFVEWIDIEDQPCGSSGVTYSIRDDLNRDSTHLIINVMPGAVFIFSKDQKTYKFGTVQYMDFDMTQYSSLDETTDGILGEFLGMTVSLDEDSIRNNTDTAILYFPDEPGRGSVIAHRVGRKNLLTNKHFHCWNVEDEGAGLVRGKARDYLVPDLHTGQRAQNLHQSEDERADAIF